MKARMTSPVVIFPQAMQALQALGKAADQGGVPRATTDLVLLRASQINGCSVCVDMNARDLKRAAKATSGSSRSQPGGMRPTSPTRSAPPCRSRRPSPGWPTDRIPFPMRCRRRRPRHYDEHGLAGLLLLIALINAWSRLNVATRQVAGEWKKKSPEARKWVESARGPRGSFPETRVRLRSLVTFSRCVSS